MYSVQKLEDWVEHHHQKWFDLIRMLLGITILIKGIAFIADQNEVTNMIRYSTSEFLAFMIAHYVIASFLVGGIAITAGFYTRTACLLQIPAIIGAIVLVDYHRNLFALNSLVIYSVVLLFLLIFFAVYGSGIYSADYYLKQSFKNQS